MFGLLHIPTIETTGNTRAATAVFGRLSTPASAQAGPGAASQWQSRPATARATSARGGTVALTAGRAPEQQIPTIERDGD